MSFYSFSFQTAQGCKPQGRATIVLFDPSTPNTTPSDQYGQQWPNVLLRVVVGGTSQSTSTSQSSTQSICRHARYVYRVISYVLIGSIEMKKKKKPRERQR